MRIDLNERLQPFPETEVSSRESITRAHRPSASYASAGEDQGELSGVHAEVRALAAQAARFPEVRQERVRALRLTIESGLYCPGPAQVAGAIFEHMITRPTA
jgi:anti-sigma28 factor (negative regulator of flagellin synthesis)